MTNEEILKKAIEKAVGNGWEFGNKYLDSWCGDLSIARPMIMAGGAHYTIIFSHSFAKAFWGEETHQEEPVPGYLEEVYNWETNLQEMVLEPEPLKYLEEFL